MDFFQTLAECSVAFAGFAAIHAVLKGGDTPRVLHRSFTVVLTGSLAFILSLLVLFLEGFGLSAETLWRVASAIAAAVCGVGGFLFYKSHIELTRTGYAPEFPVYFYIAAALLLVSVPVLLANVGGWFWSPGALAYGAALLMLLCSGLFALLGSFWFPLALAVGKAKARNDATGTHQKI